MFSCLSQKHSCKVKCKQPCSGFELMLPSPFLQTRTVMSQIVEKNSLVELYTISGIVGYGMPDFIYIYIYTSVCIKYIQFENTFCR